MIIECESRFVVPFIVRFFGLYFFPLFAHLHEIKLIVKEANKREQMRSNERVSVHRGKQVIALDERDKKKEQLTQPILCHK